MMSFHIREISLRYPKMVEVEVRFEIRDTKILHWSI